MHLLLLISKITRQPHCCFLGPCEGLLVDALGSPFTYDFMWPCALFDPVPVAGRSWMVSTWSNRISQFRARLGFLRENPISWPFAEFSNQAELVRLAQFPPLLHRMHPPRWWSNLHVSGQLLEFQRKLLYLLAAVHEEAFHWLEQNWA